jgi:hypothetical protein
MTRTHVRGGQNKLVVDDPFRGVVEPARQVQSNDLDVSLDPSRATHLVVLYGEVRAPLALLVRDLHEEAAGEGLSNVVPIVFILPRGGTELQVEPLHAPFELGPDVVGLGEGPLVEVVLPAPVLRIRLVGLVSVVDVEHGQMVAVGMGELGFGHVGFLALGCRAHEDIGDWG